MKNKLNIIMLSGILAMILGCGQTQREAEWTKAKVIAENLESPHVLAIDEKNIYFVTGGHLASLDAGTAGVWKLPILGGQPVQLFKGYRKDEKTVFLPDTFVMATDEKYLYFAAGYIYKLSKEGGEPQQITAGTPTKMVLDDENIYWHNFVGEGMAASPVYSISKKGGDVKTITDAVTIIDIAVDKDNFYWAQRDGIYKSPKNGGEKTRHYGATNGSQITGMILDQNSLYVLENDTLLAIPKIGDGIVKITSGVNSVHNFYLDEKNIYFVKNEGSFGTSINKIAKTGGDITKIDSGYFQKYLIGKEKIYISGSKNLYEIAK